MHFREAVLKDIPELHKVRMSVKENVLRNTLLVTEEDYVQHLTIKGKGWVCEADGRIVAFCILDLQSSNVWALFVDPTHEQRGIGKRLQQMMLDYYFQIKRKPLSLSTEAGSRAEFFYRKSGWKETGRKQNGEIVFAMKFSEWDHRESKK